MLICTCIYDWLNVKCTKVENLQETDPTEIPEREREDLNDDQENTAGTFPGPFL